MKRDPLREAYRALQTPGSPACPSSEVLAALVLGEIAAPERDALAEHLIACRRCSEDAGILFETHREVRDGRGVRAGSRRRLVAIAAAAALAAMVLLIARPPRPVPSAERGPAARVEGILPADGAELAGPPSRFAWPPLERAETYRVRLFHDSGELAWQSAPATAPSAELPAEARVRLVAGASYYWVVEVEGPAGNPRLGPFAFRVAPAR